MDDRVTTTPERTLIGVGLYSLAEAERLTRVPAASIRRWLFGYRYRGRERVHEGEPVWRGQIDPIGDAYALGFLDLVEIRFVHAFRRHGVSWPVIGDAARHAAEILGSDHPFASRRFRTDGKRIFAELGATTGDKQLFDLARSQLAFHSVVAPSLYEGLEFSQDDEVLRWYPMAPKRQVVIDPERAFGRPILATRGIPTDVLAKAVEVKSVERVARWYAVAPREVKAAVEFERRLAA
jgi:uncharacterized protein (DUF433 family)